MVPLLRILWIITFHPSTFCTPNVPTEVQSLNSPMKHSTVSLAGHRYPYACRYWRRRLAEFRYRKSSGRVSIEAPEAFPSSHARDVRVPSDAHRPYGVSGTEQRNCHGSFELTGKNTTAAPPPLRGHPFTAAAFDLLCHSIGRASGRNRRRFGALDDGIHLRCISMVGFDGQ